MAVAPQNLSPKASKDAIRHDRLLFLASPKIQADPLRAALKREGYTVEFTDSLQAVPGLLAKLRPGVFLLDWHAADPMQSAGLLQRLGRNADCAEVCRVIYTKEVTPQVVGLTSDTGVRRVILYGNILGLTTEIKMAHTSTRASAGLLRLLQASRAGVAYDQAAVDRAVEVAFREYPGDPAVAVEFGNLQLRRNHLPEAKAIAEGLLAADPQSVRALHLLGRILRLEDPDKAAEILAAADVLSPFNTDRLLLLADIFFKRGDVGKAGDYFQRTIEGDPDNKEARMGLGRVKLSMGDVNAALDLFRGSASEEEAVSFFNNAAVYAGRNGQVDAALRLYESALEVGRSPKLRAILHFNVALACEKLERWEAAVENLRLAVRLDPSHEKAQRQLKRQEAIAASAASRPQTKRA